MAVRIHSNYYHHFHAYCFPHYTTLPIIVKDGRVYYRDKGVNVLAWGAGSAVATVRRNRARDIGIIPPGGRNLTQRRIQDFLGRVENKNHPDWNMFAYSL